MAHKTFSGMISAADNLVAWIKANPVQDAREDRERSKKVDAMMAELNAAWSNPAQAEDAAKAKNAILDAIHEVDNALSA